MHQFPLYPFPPLTPPFYIPACSLSNLWPLDCFSSVILCYTFINPYSIKCMYMNAGQILWYWITNSGEKKLSSHCCHLLSEGGTP